MEDCYRVGRKGGRGFLGPGADVLTVFCFCVSEGAQQRVSLYSCCCRQRVLPLGEGSRCFRVSSRHASNRRLSPCGIEENKGALCRGLEGAGRVRQRTRDE
jgi:hypothetical protein